MLLLNDENIFLLKFQGEGIHPDSFSAKELGNLLIKIEDSVKSIVEENYPKSDPNKCTISLVSIADESDSNYIRAFGQPDVVPAFLDWGRALNNDSYINLPYKAYTGIKHLYTLVQSKHCNLRVVHKSEAIGTLNYEDILKNPDDALIDINTLIVGELEKIGGSKPKVWVKNNVGKINSVRITKEQAAILKPKLYDTVSLKVAARWDINSDTLSRLKLIDINDYQPGYAFEAIKRLRSVTGGFWDEFKSEEDISTFLRG
ncbi:MAG: hypothetical protein NVSMB24_06660 [Mucilaginibacter sp.]